MALRQLSFTPTPFLSLLPVPRQPEIRYLCDPEITSWKTGQIVLANGEGLATPFARHLRKQPFLGVLSGLSHTDLPAEEYVLLVRAGQWPFYACGQRRVSRRDIGQPVYAATSTSVSLHQYGDGPLVGYVVDVDVPGPDEPEFPGGYLVQIDRAVC